MKRMDRTQPTRSRRSRLTRLAVQTLTPAASLLCSLAAMAADESKSYDARLERYPGNVTLDAGGSALTWLLVIVLVGLMIVVLLKNANRSHLD